MAEPKYKKMYRLMRERHAALFEQFTPIHAGFVNDPSTWQNQFHTVGRDVLDVIRDWERRLCAGTEKSGYGAYSAGLSEKFWNEVQKEFSHIRQVGLSKK